MLLYLSSTPGGTVDVTVHRVTGRDTLGEIYKASGGAWGGTRVDESFRNLIKNVIAQKCFDTFCLENRPDLLDLEREFELRKRTVTDPTCKPVVLKVPVILPCTYEEMFKKTRDDGIQNSAYCGKAKFKRDKLHIDSNVFCGFFTKSKKSIKTHVKEILKRPEVNGKLDAIIMVGGFSESRVIVQSVRQAFPDLRVIVPQDPGLAVVKGAVLYRHCPSSISSRVCKFTYGIAAIANFQQGVHPESNTLVIDGTEYCKNS